MPENSLDQFFDDLLSEARTATAMARQHARSALMAATPQNLDSAAVSDIAAHLDSDPDSGGDGIFITKMTGDSDAIYELESAQSYLDRVAGEEQPVPLTLLRVAGAAPAAHALTRSSQFRSASFSKPLLLWSGAIAATLTAGIIGYTVHDLIGSDQGRVASPVPAFASVKKAVVRSQTAPSQGSTNRAAPPAYTAADAPIPITPHAVSVEDYPPESVRFQEQGEVKVKYLVLKDGMVGDCQVEIPSNFFRLDDAACVLVRKWRFKPATVMGGSPIEYWLDASIVFQLK